jgi:plastocyanin
MWVKYVLASISSAAIIASAACGGGGDSGGGTPSPSPTPSPTPAGVTVNIVGSSGSQAFNPNPASAGSVMTVAWKNSNGTVHRIVANDNSFDTGNIATNATSATITVPAAGVNYHCTIHPTMVGSINGTSGTAPPCTGQYCP